MYTINKGKLKICVCESREELGKYAALDAAKILKGLLEEKDEINVIFAAAPSQNETLKYLLKDEDIDWRRINAFHMDEYVGFGMDSNASFAHYLNEHIFSKVTFKNIYYICCEKDYAALIKSHPIDVVFLGIGENGHIAFNDPGVANFEDKEIIKAVKLDEKCRRQQVNDGCFKTIDDVPIEALTLTIPTLFSATYLICSVPGLTKAQAVYDTINSPISEKCPATIMRRHQNAILYIDKESASLLDKNDN
ncbi:MAG: glucosamine-6-phosphate deaminase [Bacilli bacterium]|nr:glucosamine-6-phosphate deaminase [Bacilli bacterium]